MASAALLPGTVKPAPRLKLPSEDISGTFARGREALGPGRTPAPRAGSPRRALVLRQEVEQREGGLEDIIRTQPFYHCHFRFIDILLPLDENSGRPMTLFLTFN